MAISPTLEFEINTVRDDTVLYASAFRRWNLAVSAANKLGAIAALRTVIVVAKIALRNRPTSPLRDSYDFSGIQLSNAAHIAAMLKVFQVAQRFSGVIDPMPQDDRAYKIRLMAWANRLDSALLRVEALAKDEEA